MSIDRYSREFTANQVITAKDAKDLFFLTTDDLKTLDYQRPQGWSAYCTGSGACKMYSAVEVQKLALQIWGYSALVK
jgi:hypothetical protein